MALHAVSREPEQCGTHRRRSEVEADELPPGFACTACVGVHSRWGKARHAAGRDPEETAQLLEASHEARLAAHVQAFRDAGSKVGRGWIRARLTAALAYDGRSWSPRDVGFGHAE
jgi:hypothetical protein